MQVFVLKQIVNWNIYTNIEYHWNKNKKLICFFLVIVIRFVCVCVGVVAGVSSHLSRSNFRTTLSRLRLLPGFQRKQDKKGITHKK